MNINIGSPPIISPIDGINDTDFVYTSTTLQQLKELTEQLEIVGGGYIGLEFASIYANFGSEIKVIDGSETFLPREDREIAEEVQKVLEKKKIQFEFDSRVESITNRDGKVVISYNKKHLF
ncbi:hypothetical protein CUC15_18755 [Oceanobacillus zhaokaii]|uniref:FAD/NAD(P)-binding domain-containing protein n=1 Tax=Oceanobacillus zhaokaii TaxID=2052660 RepID=A0A345PLG2_9BACI|nr:FAD-dependent oxidoreductase [Oceanobacillus zhaokaii]AXI10842.1 hypothetical protein CUC15_18755 [Oceanobacillus zhaokaii]